MVATYVLAPEDPFLSAVMGALAVLFLGFAATALAVEGWVEVVGQVVAACGWVVLAVGAAVEWTLFGLADAVGVADPVFWGGLGLVLVGGLVGFWADHGESVRPATG